MRNIIIGSESLISKELYRTLPYESILLKSKEILDFNFFEGDRVVYVSGFMLGVPLEEYSPDDIRNAWEINTIIPIRTIKYLNENIQDFTFCYIGTESVIKGSYDDMYFITKTATTRYIEEFKLKSEKSRIFSIAPSTIDSGMTLRRSDVARLKEYRNNLRIKRFITVKEISLIIKDLLSNNWIYLSNETLNINNGKFARKKI